MKLKIKNSSVVFRCQLPHSNTGSTGVICDKFLNRSGRSHKPTWPIFLKSQCPIVLGFKQIKILSYGSAQNCKIEIGFIAAHETVGVIKETFFTKWIWILLQSSCKKGWKTIFSWPTLNTIFIKGTHISWASSIKFSLKWFLSDLA